MRVSIGAVVVCLLGACLGLAGCASFCDEGELQPYDPLGRSVPPPAEAVTTDRFGRRCVNVSVFDLLGGFPDDAPAP